MTTLDLDTIDPTLLDMGAGRHADIDRAARIDPRTAPGRRVFRANELTHPNRARFDGRVVAQIVHHGPFVSTVPHRPDPRDYIAYGVRFEGCAWDDPNGSTWATPRELDMHLY